MEQRMAAAILSSSRFPRKGGNILLAPPRYPVIAGAISWLVSTPGLKSNSSAHQTHQHHLSSRDSFGSFPNRHQSSSPFSGSSPQPKQPFAKRFVSNGESGDGKPDSTVDYFGLFGLPRNFGIELSELKGTYLKLMTEHHPDKLLHQKQNSDQNNEISSITAETITHAYQTLKSPHTRALHWLELHGSPLLEDSREKVDANPSEIVGMEFLMEMMEWREAIEDAGSDQPKLEGIARETKVLHETCERALEDLLENDTETTDAKTISEARQLTAQLQYWHRLERTLKDATEVG